MAIVCAFDIHRAQLTFDLIDSSTGEIRRGRVAPASRIRVREFFKELSTNEVDVVMEGCTGWWFVADEAARAGMVAHVADPAETAALRGSKKRAKTDRADAHHLRRLFVEDRLPESWIPPQHIVETRHLIRLYLALLHDRNGYAQRIHAVLFHHGCRGLSEPVKLFV